MHTSTSTTLIFGLRELLYRRVVTLMFFWIADGSDNYLDSWHMPDGADVADGFVLSSGCSLGLEQAEWCIAWFNLVFNVAKRLGLASNVLTWLVLAVAAVICLTLNCLIGNMSRLQIATCEKLLSHLIRLMLLARCNFFFICKVVPHTVALGWSTY